MNTKPAGRTGTRWRSHPRTDRRKRGMGEQRYKCALI